MTSLECLRDAGRTAAAARALGVRLAVAGARLRDVCEAVEAEILRLGGALAFPVQSSRNHVAAHYCPSPEDETTYQIGDVAKLDIGVHVDGYVVDTAVTVNVGGIPENRPLVDAAEAALEAGIAALRPGVEVQAVSAAIGERIRSAGFRPMRNLCGHGVGRWLVHTPPPIPNEALPGDLPVRLPTGSVFALEPFATDGPGAIAEAGPPEVFRLDPSWQGTGHGNADAEVVAAIRGLNGLPFARRQLARLERTRVEATLGALAALGALRAYAPLAESRGRRVAQAEHTVLMGPDGAEVLTR